MIHRIKAGQVSPVTPDGQRQATDADHPGNQLHTKWVFPLRPEFGSAPQPIGRRDLQKFPYKMMQEDGPSSLYEYGQVPGDAVEEIEAAIADPHHGLVDDDLLQDDGAVNPDDGADDSWSRNEFILTRHHRTLRERF